MLAVVRDQVIHHAAGQFHVALLFLFDRPCHERQRVLRATLSCSGSDEPRQPMSLYMGPEDEASAMPRWDRQKITGFRRSTHARRARSLNLENEQTGQRSGSATHLGFLTGRLP